MTGLRHISFITALFLCASLVPTRAMSGAWPRGDGSAFLSFYTVQDPNLPILMPDLSAYAEYGLSPVWTIGAKVEYSWINNAVIEGEVFARWHHTDSESPFQKALSLTVSGLEGEALRIIPAFHLGRGFDTKWGGGWMDAQLKADMPWSEGILGFGAFVQAGLKPHERWMTMLSADIYADKENTYVKLLPAIAWQMGSGKYLSVEWTETVTPVTGSKIALGMWLEF